MKSSPALSHRELLVIDRDYRKAARAANLAYVSDARPGITRMKRGKGYVFLLGGRQVKDKSSLERIRKLAIPPSWSNVWICPGENGHIQATGLDLRGRKQYRYHPEWNRLRNETKFHRMIEFGKTLPVIRKAIRLHLADDGLTERKVLASVVSLMEQTYIRVGNSGYEKLYGSYGLTTLKTRHVTISRGEELRFCFTGKKGIVHRITLKDKRLARIIKQCREIPGKELFQYYDEQGEARPVDSGRVNGYLRELSGSDFTAKDFRTWAGTLHALECFCKCPEAANEQEAKKNVVSVLDAVSKKLGNTRTVCRKYYVHPGLIDLYESRKLGALLPDSGRTGSKSLEQLLLKVLKKCL